MTTQKVMPLTREKFMKDLKPSVFKKVSIRIENSGYLWGKGWSMQDCEKFESAVYPELANAGFTIKEDNSVGHSDNLCLKGCLHTSLYLHPMSFDGEMMLEDIMKVIDAINSSNHPCYVPEDGIRLQDSYEVSDKDYVDMLARYSKEILQMMKDNKGRTKYKDHTCYFRNIIDVVRFPRVGKKSYGITSMDTEWIWLENFQNIAHNLGLL